MTGQQIITFLKQYGYLPEEFAGDSIYDAPVQEAVAEYQSFDANVDLLVHSHHGRALVADGEVGPATVEAMSAPRCGHVDSDAAMPAQGTGNWPGCHGVGDFHRAIVRVAERQMPNHLQGVFWDEIIPNVVSSYRELGMDFVFKTDAAHPNINFSFVQRSNGWIGLAIVGQNLRCNSNIWCQYLATYRPANVVSEWTTLIKHELGHNCGLRHSRGGVMNPSIVRGLPVSWRGDPSEATLKRWFGGEPVPGDEPDPPDPPQTPLEQRVTANERAIFQLRAENAAQQMLIEHLLQR